MARRERSAGFVVFRITSSGHREYLLLDYGRHWDFPKGHVEKGEDDLTAALRELKEETGLCDVRAVADFQHEISYFFRDRKKGLVNKSVIFFLGQTSAGPSAIVISREHEGFEFLPYETALKRLSFPTGKQIIKLAEEAMGSQATQPGSDMLSADGADDR